MYVFLYLFNEFPMGFKFFAVICLNFKSAEKVFHYAIIHAVAFSGHTLRNIMLGKKSLVFGMLVLPILIRMK